MSNKNKNKKSRLYKLTEAPLAITPTAASFLTSMALSPYIYKTVFQAKPDISPTKLNEIFNYLKKKYNLKSTYHHLSKGKYPVPHYHPIYDKIYGTKKILGIDIHEMGHAIDLRRKVPRHIMAILGSPIVRGGGTIVGASLALSDDEEKRKYAVPVVALTKVPNLKNELGANIRGYLGLKSYIKNKKHHGIRNIPEKLKNVRKIMGASFSSYLFPALAATGATWLIKRHKDKSSKAN